MAIAFLEELGVLELMTQVRGTAIERAMVPFVWSVLLYGPTLLCGLASMHALLALL